VTAKTFAPGNPLHRGRAPLAGTVRGLLLRRKWSTPQRLVGFRMLAWIFVGLLLFVGETTLGRARAALRTIARETAPSIVAAEAIGTALADLDANVANGLLGNATHRAAAEAAIERQRVVATEGVVKAAGMEPE